MGVRVRARVRVGIGAVIQIGLVRGVSGGGYAKVEGSGSVLRVAG